MRKDHLLTLVIIQALLTIPAYGQVNAYAKISAFTDSTLTLDVSYVDETYDTFEDGEAIVIMQMQDDVLGSTSHDSSFGDLSSIGSAGYYEIVRIASHTENESSIPSIISLSSDLLRTYNLSSNSSIQIISFPLLGSPDYTSVSDISGVPWDGNLGGVIAFEVDGTFTLEHDIDASGIGFRGGDEDGPTSGSCDGSTYYSAASDQFAGKGEGIYKVTNSNYEEAKGKMLNGGGGGNEHNGGGGGGGNYSAGGEGGIGWDCGGTFAGGDGGLELGTQVSSVRVFAGGGGGGGEGNNNVSTAGADGGGIILLKADSLVTSTGASSVSISANGNDSGDAGNDGAGGAGAGGSIILDIDVFEIDPLCPLTVSANGGDGGDVGSAGVHGGGGGGGQGCIKLSADLPIADATLETVSGTGGWNDTGYSSKAGDGSGIDNLGLLDLTPTVLPIQLLSFTAQLHNTSVELSWITSSETNNDYFEVERSKDNLEWKKIGTVDGAGTSNTYNFYSLRDEQAQAGANYYRLKQVDYNGRASFSNAVIIVLDYGFEDISIYPNPSKDFVNILLNNIELYHVGFYNSCGKEVHINHSILGNRISLDLSNEIEGIYIVRLSSESKVHSGIVIIDK